MTSSGHLRLSVGDRWMTTIVVSAPRVRADVDVATMPIRPSTTMVVRRVHGTVRQTVALNAACPAKNTAVPPRTSQAVGA